MSFIKKIFGLLFTIASINFLVSCFLVNWDLPKDVSDLLDKKFSEKSKKSKVAEPVLSYNQFLFKELDQKKSIIQDLGKQKWIKIPQITDRLDNCSDYYTKLHHRDFRNPDAFTDWTNNYSAEFKKFKFTQAANLARLMIYRAEDLLSKSDLSHADKERINNLYCGCYKLSQAIEYQHPNKYVYPNLINLFIASNIKKDVLKSINNHAHFLWPDIKLKLKTSLQTMFDQDQVFHDVLNIWYFENLPILFKVFKESIKPLYKQTDFKSRWKKYYYYQVFKSSRDMLKSYYDEYMKIYNTNEKPDIVISEMKKFNKDNDVNMNYEFASFIPKWIFGVLVSQKYLSSQVAEMVSLILSKIMIPSSAVFKPFLTELPPLKKKTLKLLE